MFVFCVSFESCITCPMYQTCGTQKRTRYIDITKVTQAYGEEICRALPRLHAFTGYDSVSAFAGRGKMSNNKHNVTDQYDKLCNRNGNVLTIFS